MGDRGPGDGTDYEGVIEEADRLCDFRGMRAWIEKEFPQRHDAYRIVYSPLRGAFHFTVTVRDGRDASEILMFVAPPVHVHADPDLGTDSDADADRRMTRRGRACRIVFTEIDHNYVNPTSDGYLDEIERALPDWETWNESGAYRSAYATFNEYLTWALFSLYALETYPPEEAEAMVEAKVRRMEESRGFVRYRAFNEALVALYRSRAPEETVASLYPGIIGLFAKGEVRGP